ncbi:DUF1765-domain-containing protein [Atractiella rhizophila]|nr:DUF1765-domain-containing protein [Atractiella rhizophila]
MSNFAKQGSNERGSVVSNSLLPFIKKEELRLNYRPDERLAKRQREILFGWLDMLHQELQQVQPSHRGACLEAAAGILECRYLSAATMNEDEMGEERFKTIIVRLIAWAIDKLNDKAVYANTLVFAGRLFALAFFRIDGVALKLLRALPPVKRGSLRRILGEAGLDETDLPPVEPELFPRHLWRLCYRNFNSYFSTFNVNRNNPDPEDDGYLIRHEDIVVEMNGNWLLRWTASDSDLPFAFLRAYHRQLARYLYPDDVFHDKMDVDHPSEYIGAPGFLFLAASLMDKVDALIRRNLRSVTSISPSNNVNATESANLTMGQKPKVLELANRRLVSTILDIIGGQPTNEETEEEDKNTDPRNRHRLFGGMLKVWIKAVVKRTSLWDTRGVFLLLDWIEGLIYTICFVPLPKGVDPPPPQVPVPESVELFDILFILSFIKTILMEADNTVCLMRTIAFLYAHFEVLTLRKQDREELCEKMLLDRALFQRLFLSFNVGVRGYFQRLMVWRLSRIGVAAGDNIQQQRDPQVLKIFAIFNMRLEAVRRRHDEIDPIPDLPEDGLDDPFRPKRSTICSTRGVKEVDWVVDELEIPDVEVTVDEEELPPAPLDLIPIKPKREKEKKAVNMAAVVSWLKILNPRKGGTKRGDDPHAPIDPFTIDGPPAYAESDKFMDVTQNPEPSSFELPQLPSIPRTSSSSLAPSTSRRTKRSVSPDIPVPPSPTFFSFEFEVDAPRSDNFDPARSASALGMDPDIAVNPTPFPVVGSSTRRQSDIPKPSTPNHPISPRVSLRFSKRVSILPPPALNFFTEGGQPVPPIPDAFKAEEGYDKRLHQYAIRSLREYEEALDEFDMHYLWRAEEESSGKKADNTVPRLACVLFACANSTESYNHDTESAGRMSSTIVKASTLHIHFSYSFSLPYPKKVSLAVSFWLFLRTIIPNPQHFDVVRLIPSYLCLILPVT